MFSKCMYVCMFSKSSTNSRHFLLLYAICLFIGFAYYFSKLREARAKRTPLEKRFGILKFNFLSIYLLYFITINSTEKHSMELQRAKGRKFKRQTL